MTKKTGEYEKDGYKFNFCSYVSDTKSFATKGDKTLTGDDYVPSKTGIYKKDNFEGVTIERKSKNVCKQDSKGKDVNYAFTMNVICNKDIKGQGEGKIDSLDTSDECHPKVTVSHADGCYQYTASNIVRLLSTFCFC